MTTIKASREVGKAFAKFIITLHEGRSPSCVIDRNEDRARQLACKHGLVTFDKKANKPRGAGWKISDKGRELLDTHVVAVNSNGIEFLTPTQG